MTESKTTAEVDEAVDAPSKTPEQLDRLAQCRDEEKMLKEWKRGGKVGDRPSTPMLDEMTAAYEAAGCAPGSSLAFLLGKTERSPRGTSTRAPAMSDVELVRRLRDLLDATPTLSQTAATNALTAEGATIRQVRAAYKAEILNRPKAPQPARAEKPRSDTPDDPSSALDAARAVLDEIRKPHTAAELVAIAEANAVAGVRVKMGKGEIVDRITAAVTARTKHLRRAS